MGRAMDYDDYAGQYAHTRWAVPWIVNPLVTEVKRLTEGSTIIDIGCGTGNYVIALFEVLPHYTYQGFDVSEGMLKVARLRCNQIPFKKGNADARFPYSSAHCDLAFAVDVMHHIENIDVFFCEVARILKPQGRLLIVTDSEKNIRNRSLTRYFPEALHIELDRYPSMEELHETAARAGLTFVETEAAEGAIKLNDSFISELEMKCSSALRLIPSDAHQRGMQRIRRAQRQSEKWISCYTMVKYERVESS